MNSDRCFICGDTSSHIHESHHLVPRRLNGSDNEDNLVNLCPNCHRAIEKLYNRSFYERLSDRLSLSPSLNERGTMARDSDVDLSTGRLSDKDFRALCLQEQIVYAYNNPEMFANLSRKLQYCYSPDPELAKMRERSTDDFDEDNATLEERIERLKVGTGESG